MGDILSQDDLDALLGDLFPTKTEDRRIADTEVREVDMSAADVPSETLSQDDIDKLLAEFGK
jgi:flagellar motor switch protein FliM